ncbi:kinesin-like protein KIN-7L, chloroplastic [Euphorbia lathyris]|uniref:kinesin-like protein KIN-7L, chloroplastic n=1 Tax=Euphorbia lathyris TaxID=212925 RepID=UPI00331414C6
MNVNFLSCPLSMNVILLSWPLTSCLSSVSLLRLREGSHRMLSPSKNRSTWSLQNRITYPIFISASSSMEETHNTLKFANRAKRVKICASRNKGL